jgi:transposase
VSNIVNELKKGIDTSEYESIREIALFSKREGITLNDLASHVRLINYIKKLGADPNQIESLIPSCKNNAESFCFFAVQI